MIRRTIREYERIAFGDCEKTIPEWAAGRLARVAAASPLAGRGGSRVLAHGRKDLGAGQIVGVIAANQCALEILPKIDGLGDCPDGEQKVRDRLINMLAVALDIRIDGGSMTELGTQRDNLLEVLIGLFATKLAEAVRRGMPRRYRRREEDLAALRGSLDPVRQFTTLAANPARLACRYDDMSRDIPLNQAMKAAVTLLLKVSSSPLNRRLLTQLAFDYADIVPVAARSIRWDSIALDRTNERWRELVGLARLLLGGEYQTTSGGSEGGFSLLFEMNALFEAYVARLLAGMLAATPYRVVSQGGRLYCLWDENGKGRFQTRPDLLVKDGDEVVLIIDTKWKRIAPRIDDPKQGVSQADVYQMMAYGRLYRCRELMLLYPHHSKLGEAGATGMHSVANCDDRLTTATLDLARDSRRVGTDLASVALGRIDAARRSANRDACGRGERSLP